MKNLLFLGDSITDCNHYFDPDNLGYGYVRIISDKLSKTKTPELLKQAIKSKGLERSLKVAIPKEVYEALEKEYSEINE